MKFGGIFVVRVLAVAIICSSFVGLADSCGQLDAGPVPLQGLSGHQHGDVTAQQADDAKCACCDNCAVVCASSACNPGAATFASMEIDIEASIRLLQLETIQHDGPERYPPFRPPIQHA